MGMERRDLDKQEVEVKRMNNRLPEANTVKPEVPKEYESNPRKLPEKVFRLRQKLYCKAKQEPKYRFYSLYNQICREDVIRTAWGLVEKNKGAAGTDGQEIKSIDPNELIKELQKELETKTYKTGAIKRVYIPKANGEERPLGIPNVRDRVVQMAVLLIIEPIIEADFLECSNGFRPGRGAKDALEQIDKYIKEGREEVYDADLKSYFDTIPHDKLMACVRQRITDSSVLKLIMQWLKAVVVETDKDGKTKGGRPKQGTPQGGVLSPLLANLYLHNLDKVFHGKNSPTMQANARIVRYADDFVILAKKMTRNIIEPVEAFIEKRLGLVINRNKTKIRKLGEPEEVLDFLGYTFRFDKDLKGRDKKYLNLFPAKKSIKRAFSKIRELTSSKVGFQPMTVTIKRVNTFIKSWAEYFKKGYPSKMFKLVNWYAGKRILIHSYRKSQRPYKTPAGMSKYAHLKNLGLCPI